MNDCSVGFGFTFSTGLHSSSSEQKNLLKLSTNVVVLQVNEIFAD